MGDPFSPERLKMKPVIDFMRGLRKLPIIIQIWLMILGMSNMMFPLFYISHVEAQVMFAATVLSFAIGVIMYKTQGMTRSMGLMHAPWLIAIYFLMKSVSNIGFDDPFGIWMGVALLLTSISLIFDIVDTIRYIAGNRESLI